MFALIVSYTKLPEVVAEHANTHSVWVKKYLDNGTFLFAGPKLSKLGGVILAKGDDKAAILRIIAEDSFVKADVAEYQVIQFDCKLAIPELEMLKGI